MASATSAAFGCVVVNDHNEVLLVRPLLEDGGAGEKWVVPTGKTATRPETSSHAKAYVKTSTDVDIDVSSIFDLDGPLHVSLEDGYEGVDGPLQIVRGVLARSRSDIQELGARVLTAGWFTQQEVRWYWDKISPNSQVVLLASKYVSNLDVVLPPPPSPKPE